MRYAVGLLIVLLLLPLFSGCTALISVPEKVSEPRTVQLLTHGRHSSILLTAANQTRLRYAYGDWAWYVDNEQGIASGSRALFMPSKAAFGRQLIAAAQPGEQLERAVGVGIGQAYLFQVEAARVDALLAQLEQQFTATPATPFYSTARNLNFVPHSHPYSLSHNSNHQVADWLRALGLEISGNQALGYWRVKENVAAK
ncbi:hypothetical protein WG68_12160 [Arsukibacterium ikkense]|uniref:Lipoprotein n=1 Tax=Arsukibacterium ikkense TaxID=336831 RepID=A0A0M2V7P8_9GAMM|nr:hypothetical protein [Arsukibacterium ikkense]KKO45173.1 hypothetical protein WG68_12160 [Arsukibacterium ikkense]